MESYQYNTVLGIIIFRYDNRYNKFLTQKEIMVTQISAALPSDSEKSYVKKISVYFLAICANFPCKIESFESEVVGVGILETGFCFQGSHEHIL